MSQNFRDSVTKEQSLTHTYVASRRARAVRAKCSLAGLTINITIIIKSKILSYGNVVYQSVISILESHDKTKILNLHCFWLGARVNFKIF